MKKNHVRKIFFVSVCLLAVSWTAAAILFWSIQNKGAKASQLISSIAEQTARKDEIQTLARNTENLKDEIKELDNIFIENNQEEVVKFIENIESIAQTSDVGLIIDDVQIVPIIDGTLAEKFENVNLHIETEGSWSEIFHFLSLLESLKRHIVWKELRLELFSDTEVLTEKIVWRWKGYFDIKVTKLK